MGKTGDSEKLRTTPRMPRILAMPIALIALLAACAAPQRLTAVPVESTIRAEVPGVPDVRFWVDKDITPMVAVAQEVIRREQEFLARSGHTGPLPPVSFLAVSGGGDNGAFGAGLLNGWTEAGTRPSFKVVTGVSTGALIAPFAFLGPEYDAVLKEVYTTVSKDDIFKERGMIAALFDDAMADTVPMLGLVSRHVTPEMLSRIAAEYEKGRVLLVGTTNLDARRPVIWNMTAIAARGDAAALDLFRRILVASAAIPGAFPPMMIEVEVDGQRYQEMHVDGGTMAQVFLYPPSLKLGEYAKAENIERERSLYIIRNARLDPEWASVERRTLGIAGRAISSLIHSQGIGDLYRIYLTATRDGLDYNLAYIPEEFDAPHPEQFDTGYMQALYDLGYQMARKGYPWQKYPPGYQPTEAAASQ